MRCFVGNKASRILLVSLENYETINEQEKIKFLYKNSLNPQMDKKSIKAKLYTDLKELKL